MFHLSEVPPGGNCGSVFIAGGKRKHWDRVEMCVGTKLKRTGECLRLMKVSKE